MVNFVKKDFNSRVLSIPEFVKNRNKILVTRSTGGAGDIFMHRMMFEDFKSLMPQMHLTFATPKQYHSVVEDHPFLDDVIDSEEINFEDYMICYNTTTACTRYENKIAPYSDMHRSDIWANHCGVKLKSHEMHFKISKENKEFARQYIEKIKKKHPGPVVGLSPVSSRIAKDLLPWQIDAIVDELRKEGCFILGLHDKPIDHLSKIQVPQIGKIQIDQWLAIINEVSYLVSVDTGTYHAAGGLKKPLMGVFTYADGKVYGKYFDSVLVQKHRDNGNWKCGPCFNWPDCPKTNNPRKPCLTEITENMLRKGVRRMLNKWPANSFTGN